MIREAAGISCLGRVGSWNQGVECQFYEKDGGCRCGSGDGHSDEVALEAKAWMDEHGLPPYSSTFTVEHRFKPGDRIRQKDTARPVTTVDEVVFTADCGAFYRFAEDGTPTSSVSYCDENLRLADCEEEVGKTEEIEP